MKNIAIVFNTTLVFGLLLFSSCQKETPENILVSKSIQEMEVPGNFDWSTTGELDIQVSVQTEDHPEDVCVITIYSAAPWDNGSVILKGAASQNQALVTRISVPAGLSELYVKRVSPSGISEIAPVPVVNQSVIHTFSRPMAAMNLKSMENGPDCNSGCNQTISGSGNVNIGDGQTYCVTGSFTGNINFQNSGGSLKVCGNLDIGNLNLGSDCHLIIADGATVAINGLTMSNGSSVKAYGSSVTSIHSLNMNHSSSNLENFSSSFSINSAFSPNGSVLNEGLMVVNGGININNNGTLINAGTLDINGSLQTNDELINQGTIDVSGHVNLNNSEVTNSCNIICAGDFNINNCDFVNHSGYVYVGLKMSVNGGADVTMNYSTLFDVYDLTVNNDMHGYGTLNTINVRRETRVNGGNVQVNGAIEVADNDGVLAAGSVSGNFALGATFVSLANATNFIPATGCNSTGFGTPTVVDSDNDGISDSEDAYPNDPAKAFDSWFPNASEWSTLAFEDLWPGMGDYDFNDLVLVYRIRMVTNASNLVVNLKPSVFVSAAGASYKNGFGIQFDNLIPSQIQSITGQVFTEGIISLNANGTEAGQSKAVVMFFDNYRSLIQGSSNTFFNTQPLSEPGISDTVALNITFTNPLPVASIGSIPLNPFIIVNGVRSHEIHLLDKLPTDLMDYSLFGTGSDASIPAQGQYYRTDTNLPWAIHIPVLFNHMVEKKEITSGYLSFSSWAESGGSAYQQWYRTQLSGYTDLSNIWMH